MSVCVIQLFHYPVSCVRSHQDHSVITTTADWFSVGWLSSIHGSCRDKHTSCQGVKNGKLLLTTACHTNRQSTQHTTDIHSRHRHDKQPLTSTTLSVLALFTGKTNQLVTVRTGKASSSSQRHRGALLRTGEREKSWMMTVRAQTQCQECPVRGTHTCHPGWRGLVSCEHALMKTATERH